jgi:glucosamine--fructose-6-phosphate aminotransferase (isomerizing)
MCGIVGYVGRRPARELVLRGLERLEYRGYDSAGVTVVGSGTSSTVRAVGNLARLRAAVASGQGLDAAAAATTGIGHTRWATHGRVTKANAHPHCDDAGRVHIVLNGIVENHASLRRELEAQDVRFASETDAEVVAHLIGSCYEGDLVAAVRAARRRIRGPFAFGASSVDEPDVLVGARRECPVVVGVGLDERFVASALPAFLAETRDAFAVEDGELVVATADDAWLESEGGRRTARTAETVAWSDDDTERGGWETFMLKEIHEQPDVVARTLFDRAPDELAGLDLLGAAKRLRIVACGTSYHAGLAARFLFERWAQLDVEVDLASEWRHRDVIVRPGDVLLGITQSGETADTLGAMRLAAERGVPVLALSNVLGSQATRDADASLLTCAGIEVSVAATKTFTAQVSLLALVALRVAERRGALSADDVAALVAEMERLPDLMEQTIAAADAPVQALAERWHDQPFFLFLGRHAGVPAALEGALKLKEIAYVPCDAYAAGEMKHGPIALLDEGTPVVAVATRSPVLDKTLSNLAEVRARGAEVLAVATEGDDTVSAEAEHVVAVPDVDALLQPLLAVIPLQLLAYRIARRRGLDVDQPRNLAKTVTVQ